MLQITCVIVVAGQGVTMVYAAVDTHQDALRSSTDLSSCDSHAYEILEAKRILLTACENILRGKVEWQGNRTTCGCLLDR